MISPGVSTHFSLIGMASTQMILSRRVFSGWVKAGKAEKTSPFHAKTWENGWKPLEKS